ncbi:hypothetical protein C1H46_006784 [Malus baccata]|uniref:Uncharacterized protein n=1 Tax=Malus baccata TaxID=106549 RepID=A0A540N9A7_MALBA|nr:hypothetical protein C1H46_006784 [Malus baccata]
MVSLVPNSERTMNNRRNKNYPEPTYQKINAKMILRSTVVMNLMRSTAAFRMKKINSDQTTFLNTSCKYHTRLKVQRLKYKIKYSKSNWSKSIAIKKLSKLKINHENLKHQVQANGWQT